MYDAIVVGARCGGSPTVMLLARHGYRVLLVDQATFPSDTVSTHFIWPPGLACLKQWGLMERVLASNSPAFRTIGLDLGDYVLTGDMPPTDGVAEMSAPRRIVLDKLLRDAALEAGAEIRESTTVTGLNFADHRVTGIRCRGRSGTEFTEQARIVMRLSRELCRQSLRAWHLWLGFALPAAPGPQRLSHPDCRGFSH
jgi:flavin-dependent dehydrogenase